jgi:hypothetical protein
MPYTIDGQPVNIDKEPQIKDGTLWVPFRALGEALGGSVSWDQSTRTVTLLLGPYTTTLRIDDATVDTDGQSTQLQAPPYVNQGDTWVPVRFFNQPLGYQIGVDLANRQVDIINPATATNPV